MSILALLHFFSFLVYLYMAGFVLYKNPKALLNRVCALLLLCFVIWSFGAMFISDVIYSKDTARLAMNIYSIGWCSFAGFSLWFDLVFAKKEKVLKKKITYILLFLPAAFFIYKQWTNFLIVDYISQPYGWSYAWSKSIWRLLFYIYYSSYMLYGLYLIFDYGRKTKRLREKKQTNVIFITTLISLILGSIGNTLLQELNIHRLPALADVFALIWLVGLVYTITRYGLMTISPETAANNILATMDDSLILLDPDSQIITVNQATLDLLGYKKQELIGSPVTAIFSDGDYVKRFQELMQKGSIRDYDTFYRTSSKEKIPVSLFMSLLKDKAGELAGIVCIAKDMREIRRLMQKEKELAIAATAAEVERRRAAELEKLNQDLKDTQVQLIQSAKMAAVGQLGAGVAHELNNPLGGILGYAQFILEKIKRPEFSPQDFKSCIKYMESIERESTRCKGIVESLLKFSRRPISPQPELIDVALAINETLAIIGHQLKLKNITLTTDIPEGLDKVFGITNQLQQVFTNLILNAQQAMPEGGQLKIAARNILGENKVEIEFTDTGCGISEEHLKHIFEPFFTTKQKEKGTGLGLAVSYQLIQEHKGTIEINSQVGKGTTVRVILPIAEKKQLAV